MVLKFSGKNLFSENFKKIVEDIAVLHALHIYPIIVHGAGPQIEEKLSKNSHKIRGLRVTSKQEIEIIEELMPKVTEKICDSLHEWGLESVNFSRDIFEVYPKNFPDYNKKHYTGEIKNINNEKILEALEQGSVPIFSALVYDKNQNPLNVNADEIALKVAETAKAKKLIFFSDVAGVLDEDKKLISVIPTNKITELETTGIISGGMIPKLEACRHAINHGVERCHIVSGLVDGAILKEVFTPEGIGTMIIKK